MGQSRSKGRSRSRPTPPPLPGGQQETPASGGHGSDEYYTSGRRPRREQPTASRRREQQPTASSANGPLPIDGSPTKGPSANGRAAEGVEARVATLQRELEAARAEASLLLTDPTVQSRWALRDKRQQVAKHPAAANCQAPAQPPQRHQRYRRVAAEDMSAAARSDSPPQPPHQPLHQPLCQPPLPPQLPPVPALAQAPAAALLEQRTDPQTLESDAGRAPALSASKQLVLPAAREVEADFEVEAALAGARLYLEALTGRDAGGGNGGGGEEEREEEEQVGETTDYGQRKEDAEGEEGVESSRKPRPSASKSVASFMGRQGKVRHDRRRELEQRLGLPTDGLGALEV